MKRYLLFSGYYYYPNGGWSDFRGIFDTIEECIEEQEAIIGDWYQIVDTKTWTIREKGNIPRCELSPAEHDAWPKLKRII